MKDLERIYVPYKALLETTKALRLYGEMKCEGLLLWLGHISSENTAYVTDILNPPQDSIKSEEGVGYFITAETLFSLNKLLSDTGLRLLAQVHSHPGQAYHSVADDRYCIVTMEGGFSIVVPDFGFGPPDLSQWATYRLIDGIWEKLPMQLVESIFYVEGNPTSDIN